MDFAVLRAPILPWDEITDWCTGLTAPHCAPEHLATALDADTKLLRRRLRVIMRRPDICAALYIASPHLARQISPWLDGDETEPALRVEPALTRYFLRMAGRATPFGLFAGAGVGRVERRTHLAAPERSGMVRHTWLDIEYIRALTAQLAMDPQIRAELTLSLSSTLYEVEGRYRWVETRKGADRDSSYLVATEVTPYLRKVVEFCRSAKPTRLKNIVEELARTFDEITTGDARAFIHQIIDAQLLTSTLTPGATGTENIQHLTRVLKETPGLTDTTRILGEILTRLAQLDANGFDIDVAKYGDLIHQLRMLCKSTESDRCLHVDLQFSRYGFTLGQAVAEEIAKGVEVLVAISPETVSPLVAFVDEFQERYSDRKVPLLEALDDECGIGFGAEKSAIGDASPLLADLQFKPSPKDQRHWSARDNLLLGKLVETLKRGENEIRLGDADMAALASEKPKRPMPPGVSVILSIAAPSNAAIDKGDYRILLKKAVGPSSAKLLGRFCRGDPDLAGHVRSALEQQDGQELGAIHAEVAYLPPGRASNVVCRPVLRGYEIAINCRSGVDQERQIPLSDILVAVRNGDVELHSQKLGRRLIPHLSCAHAFRGEGLGIYQFLACLEEQDTTNAIFFSWGALKSSPFLPRVTYQRFVLALAQWNVEGAEFKQIAGFKNEERFRAIQELRHRLNLPQWVFLVDADNTLAIDLQNIMAIDCLLAIAKSRKTVTLSELFPDRASLMTSSEGRRFCHELVLPLVRAGTPPAQSCPSIRQLSTVGDSPRQYFPGEDWLFAKLYCSENALDRLLDNLVHPLVKDIRDESWIDQWFFVRFGDPNWHLRLRIKGHGPVLWQKVAPLLFARARDEQSLIRRLTLDTYVPEAERYGGLEGLEVSEQLFEIDSDTAVEIVRRFQGDPEARWRLAVLGIHDTLDQLDFNTEEKIRILTACRDNQLARLGNDGHVLHKISKRYRDLRPEIDRLLDCPPEAYAPGVEALRSRRCRLGSVAVKLRELENRGTLSCAFPVLAAHYLHMWTNRIFRVSANAHEVVLCEFLSRAYRSREARLDRHREPQLPIG